MPGVTKKGSPRCCQGQDLRYIYIINIIINTIQFHCYLTHSKFHVAAVKNYNAYNSYSYGLHYWTLTFKSGKRFSTRTETPTEDLLLQGNSRCMCLQISATAFKINLEGWMSHSPQASYAGTKKFTRREIKKILNLESKKPPRCQLRGCSH